MSAAPLTKGQRQRAGLMLSRALSVIQRRGECLACRPDAAGWACSLKLATGPRAAAHGYGSSPSGALVDALRTATRRLRHALRQAQHAGQTVAAAALHERIMALETCLLPPPPPAAKKRRA